MIAVLALPAVWFASAVTSWQLESSANCTGDSPHVSCSVDGTFAALVVAALSVVAVPTAAALRLKFPHRRVAEWVPAVLWSAVIVIYLALPAAG